MSEEFAESVTSEAPVSVTPELLNKPFRPDESSEADSDLLKHKLGLANQHAKQAKKDAEEVRQQLQELKNEYSRLKEQQQETVQKSLEDQGQFKTLYEQERQRNKELESRYLSETSELRSELESLRTNWKQENLRAASLARISQSNAVNPEQLYTLLQTRLRQGEEGTPVVLDGGVEQPLDTYLNNLKQAQEWQHHFSASGARGIGTSPSATVAPGMSNPYKTGNMTEALKLEVTNPELAKALRSEATAGNSR